MITSSSNAQVKNIIALNKKAKERREQDVFVAEGWKMFQEAPREWLKAAAKCMKCRPTGQNTK